MAENLYKVAQNLKKLVGNWGKWWNLLNNCGRFEKNDENFEKMVGDLVERGEILKKLLEILKIVGNYEKMKKMLGN